jgi:hypothetical protein
MPRPRPPTALIQVAVLISAIATPDFQVKYLVVNDSMALEISLEP